MHRALFHLSLSIVLLSTIIAKAQAQGPITWKEATANGYTYKYVSGDPMKTRFYTLKNGLTVMLTVNQKEPRLFTLMGVRTGSNNDPSTHTGLAHYLEHMLFKGTDKYGSLDWAKEKPLLDKIEDLYEKYNKTTDPDARKEIYAEIDRTSGEAAKYAIAQEYDKLMAEMGADNTNAHTWVDETVYQEDIPSTSIDKFLAVQSERYRFPVFRLFHTELEAVYEEKNRGLDNDGWKINEALMGELFKKHNYGQQTTIGTIEHLKNPSLKEIRKYYDTYYVPNNLCLVFAGDFNPDEVIAKIDKAFAYMKSKPVTPYTSAPEAPIAEPKILEVWGPTTERVQFGFRTPANNTRDALVLDLISSILSNGKAGLIDLNINQQQKMLGGFCGMNQMKDYGVFLMGGTPKQGQTLDEVKQLLLDQLELLKQGKYDEQLVTSIINNTKKDLVSGMEGNSNRANTLMDLYIGRRDWKEVVSYTNDLSSIKRAEIIAVANKYLQNNFVAIYKRKGEDKSILKVEKPSITPIEVNREAISPFVKNVNEMAENSVKPLFLDYNKDFSRGKLDKSDVFAVKNEDNNLFRLYYRFNMGDYNNKKLSLAASYISLLGTDKASAEDIKKQFYQIACSYNVNVGKEEMTISLEGLQENFEKAVTLMENVIRTCKPDEPTLENLKGRMIKSRNDVKGNKGAIMAGLQSYALYGEKNPYNYVLTNEEIKAVKATELTDLMHSLFDYPHDIVYYGPMDNAKLTASLKPKHLMPKTQKLIPAAVKFEPKASARPQVYFADFDMVQAELAWARPLSKGFKPELAPELMVFNEYFGGGMSGLVFSTIRESKALAYSTNARLIAPSKKDEWYRMTAYVGTQADKLPEAVKAMNELINDLPETKKSFNIAKTSIRKSIETDRIINEGKVFSFLNARKLGIDYDIRKSVYDKTSTMTFADLQKMHKEYIANKPFNYAVIGSENKVSKEELAKYGEFHQVKLDDLFGFGAGTESAKP
ncbi:MAG: insulinase family protein [Saprospiraceae bacterium]